MPRSVNPRPQFFDSAGDPLISGLMYFYEPGTTTSKNTYSDVNLSTANANPVVLSADGRMPSVFFDGSCRQVLREADGTLIWDIDPVGGANITGPLSEWSPDVTYGMFDIVITSDGKLWRSLIDANTDNAPASSASSWEQLEFITIWNTNVTYALNATVKASDGLFYKSTLNGNLGNNPTTDPVKWISPVPAVATLALPAGSNQTTSFNASSNIKYVCNFSAAATITLPAAPTVGDVICLAMGGQLFVTLAPNSLKINGSTSNFVTDSNQTLFITYTGTTNGWV
jgi:hypothetical protein